MSNIFIHESSYVDDGVEIGPGSKVWHFSHIMSGSKIGHNCNIGQNVTIGPLVANCTIGSYAFVRAGAVVNRDLSDYALVVGNPAKQNGWMEPVRQTIKPSSCGWWRV